MKESAIAGKTEEAVPTSAETLGVSRSSVSAWLKVLLKVLLVEGVGGLCVQWQGGRPSKLTPLIYREFQVAYNVHYIATLLKNLGFSGCRHRK